VTPARWSRIKEIFSEALETPEAERPLLLELACGGDADLRAEVERLLAGNAEPSWQSPAAELLAESSLTQLSAGARLGHYQIVAMLGRGGMGVVYRARDTQLGREVAIKVLPDSLARDPDRLTRFNREAKLLASLNHPNIAHIYGVESHALVMELVEGETLGPLTKSRLLPLKTALTYARQMAEALEAAHEKGIVHRDLKPANIMVTPAGVLKVLDFGLAKAEEPVAAGDPAESPTVMPSPTVSGFILGTAAYMSPEQARGSAIDRRTDIWAFGTVLFEMLTGRRAFPGESVTDILAAVLRGEPDWSALPAATPPGIRKLLRRCLERDRDQRLQAIGEARIEIEAALDEESDSSSVASLIKKHKKAAIGSVALVAALVVAAWFLMHRPPKPSTELTQKRLTFNSSENPIETQAISPDGKYLAYSDPTGIHVRLLATEEDRLISRPAGIPADAWWIVFSWFPDGTQLLAGARDEGVHKSIWTVSVLGQSPRKLREDAFGYEVSPDGTHIAFQSATSDQPPREIWVMGSRGDNPHKILGLPANEHLYWLKVHWSPDGRRLAYIRSREQANTRQDFIETCDLTGANRTAVMPDMNVVAEDFRWLSDGRIVYAREDSPGDGNSNLWEIGIDNHAGTPIGKTKRITSGGGSFIRRMNVSADGKRLALLKLTDQWQTFLGELAAGGTRLKLAHRLTNNDADERPTGWTADSKTVLLTSNRGGTGGIYKQGINQETSETVITGQGLDPYGRLSPDAGWILFIDPLQHMMRIPVSGGVPQLVLEARNGADFRCARAPANLCVIFETSQDEKQFMVTAFDPVKGRGRVLRTVENGPPHPYGKGELSPDGSMLAISRTDEAEIHLRLLSLSGGSDREITLKGWPNITGLDWSPDGKGLYCGSASSQGGTLLYVDLQGSARVLWQYKGGGRLIHGAPSPDGRYLAIGVQVTNSNVWMLEGF